jgi:hypothetical protein
VHGKEDKEGTQVDNNASQPSLKRAKMVEYNMPQAKDKSIDRNGGNMQS